MCSSADIAILIKIAELAKRYGMRPSEADASFGVVQNSPHDIGHFELSFTGMTIEKQANFEKMTASLGSNEDGILIVNELSDLEDIVDQALARAPRARSV